MTMADLYMNTVDISLTQDGQMFWNCSLCLQGKNDAASPASSVNIHWVGIPVSLYQLAMQVFCLPTLMTRVFI